MSKRLDQMLDDLARLEDGRRFYAEEAGDDEPHDYLDDDRTHTLTRRPGVNGWRTDQGCAGYGMHVDDAVWIEKMLDLARRIAVAWRKDGLVPLDESTASAAPPSETSAP